MPQPRSPDPEHSRTTTEPLDVGDNLHALRFDAATQELLDWARRIDAATAARERAAALLGELAWRANVRGQLDVHVAGALKVVAAAVDVSPRRLRVAVEEAVDGVTPT
jgi:hypothetical protein